MKLKRLNAKGFRGFNNEQTILLDNNIVLVYGLNGSGKSSFTEALEWLFFDEISRQRLSRCKSEYQYEEYLKNVFYNSQDNAFVEVEGTIKGTPVFLRKEMSPEGTKYFINKVEFDNFDSLELNLEKYFRPMLAQTEIKALVDSEQKERWEQISSILGQDDLSALRENLIKLRNNKKDDDYKQSGMKFNGIVKDIEDEQQLNELLNSFKKLSTGELLEDIKKVTEIEKESFEEILIEIKEKIQTLFNSDLGKKVTEISYLDNKQLETYLNEIEVLFNTIEEEAIKATYNNTDHDYISFLSLGKNITTPPKCPFCVTSSLTEKRLQEIDSILKESKSAQDANLQFIEEKKNTDEWINNFPNKVLNYLPNKHALKIIAQKFNDIEEVDIAIKTQQLEVSIAEFVTKYADVLIKHKTTNYKYIESKYFHNETETPKCKLVTESTVDILKEITEITNSWIDLKKEMAKSISLEENIDQNELRKWLLVEKITKFILDNTSFIEKNSLLITIDNIQEKLETYEKEEISRLLEQHGNEIKTYYKKLNPFDEVQFSGIETLGGKKRQAKLKAKAFGVDINPITFFSEAHTNSLALSIYFPQRVDRNETWECVILDDPVQSMDENHSHALIDILFDISQYKQIIILTHSKEFYKRICSRFTDKKSLNYNFYYNENEGPSIQLDKGDTESYLQSCESKCIKGDPKSLEEASALLRKGIESICMDYLERKGISFTKIVKTQKSGLSNLFSLAETHGLPTTETSKLKSLLDISNPSSHARVIANTTPQNIRIGMSYINDIRINYGC